MFIREFYNDTLKMNLKKLIIYNQNNNLANICMLTFTSILTKKNTI